MSEADQEAGDAPRVTLVLADDHAVVRSGLRLLLEAVPQTGVVVLTMQEDPAFAREALRAGALGYVLKEAADEELLQAVRLAADGETYLNPRLGARLAAEPPVPPGP